MEAIQNVRYGCLVSACLLLACGPSRVAAKSPASEDLQVANLTAFARTYGYVRFFCPSDQAVAVDWDKLGILGAADVRKAKDTAALRESLLKTFGLIAPGLEFTMSGQSEQPGFGEPAPEQAVTFWQYCGLNLTGEKENVYRQARVVIGRNPQGRTPLFVPADIPHRITKTLAPGLVLHLTPALPVDDRLKTSEPPARFAGLQAQLASTNLDAVPVTDWRLRVAGIAKVWNVFQHFHPYLGNTGVDWNAALPAALRRTLHDETAEDYYATLSELVARTQDGHGYIYGRPKGVAGLPLRVAWIEDKIVVTGFTEGLPLRKGDIVESVDGTDALDVLKERERYVSGSPQTRRFRALNQFGEGKAGSVARLTIRRGNARKPVEIQRRSDGGGFFFNPVGEFDFPGFAEVRPGIFYVNVQTLDAPTLEAKLTELAKAKGVIVDMRVGGRKEQKDFRHIQIHSDIIGHLISESVKASPMRVPKVSQPDREGWSHSESSWPVWPRTPCLAGKTVFINDPGVVSYGETCMAMIVYYRLATLVGEPTAGCNGNVVFIPLPGGFRVMWTGMDVRKHDGSPFYLTGFLPDVPVKRTLRAVAEARDEFLEKAIEVIENSDAGKTASGN